MGSRPGHSNGGRGDLLLTDGRSTFAVIEAKHIEDRTGATARTKRKDGRTLVRKQALGYARDLVRLLPQAIEVHAFTLVHEAQTATGVLEKLAIWRRDADGVMLEDREHARAPSAVAGPVNLP